MNPAMLTVFRARLAARLHLWAVGEIDDLETTLDELLVDVFQWAAFGPRIDDSVDELVRAWCIGGAAALDEPKNSKLLRSLWDVQLDELQRRIDAIKKERGWARSGRSHKRARSAGKASRAAEAANPEGANSPSSRS